MIVFFFNMCYTSICSTFFHDFFFPFCKIMFNHSSSASSIIVICRIGTLWTVKSGGIFYSQLFRDGYATQSQTGCYFILQSEVTESLRPNIITFHKRIGYKIQICSMFNSPSGYKFNSFWRGREGKFLHMSQNVFMLHHCTHCLLCLVNNLHTLLLEKRIIRIHDLFFFF